MAPHETGASRAAVLRGALAVASGALALAVA